MEILPARSLPPFMPDSNEAYSHDVWYSLEQNDDVWLLTVGVDSEWLASEDRVYPVTIDPTIIEDKNESQFVAGVASEIAYPGDFKVGAAVGYHDNGPGKDDYTGWQFASCVIVPSKDHQEKTLGSITVILAYDLNMNRVSFDDISLRKEPCTTYTYDEKGNVTAVNATGNSEGAFEYNAGDKRLTKSTSESMGTYEYKYENDNNDQLVTKIINDGASMNIEYDLLGNSIQTVLKNETKTTQLPIVSSAAYSDDGSQLASQTDTNGYTTSYEYNQKRLAEKVTNNAGTVTQTTYYDSDRVKNTYISGTVSLLREYTNGLLETITRGGYIPGTAEKQNQVYTMAYDAFGNMTSIKVGDDITLAAYEYDSQNGQLKRLLYGNYDEIEYVYDNLGRLVAEVHLDSGSFAEKTYQFFYDSEGNLEKKPDVKQNEAVHYEYDSLGRLIRSWETSGDAVEQKTEHLYDTANRIKQQNWQLGDTVYSETYTYNEADGSLTRVDSPTLTDSVFEYDKLKRLSDWYDWYFQKTYTYRDLTASTTTQTAKIDYSQRTGGTSFAAFSLSYDYDNLGNIKSVDASVRNDLDASYEYDIQGQLTEETSNGITTQYSYDTYGNIRTVTQGTDAVEYKYENSDWLDLLTSYDGEQILYQRQKTVTDTPDTGNPISYYNGTRWRFDWYYGRQMTSAISDDCTAYYEYDLNSIRDKKTVNGVTYNFITQNGKVVRQTWTEGETSHVMDFIYDNTGSPYICVYDGKLYEYVLNLQGDVIAMIDLQDFGATVATYTYDAWGNILASSGDMAAVNPLRYRGYYYDSETGFYYLQSRYYDPVVRRFINADTFASTGQGFVGFNMFVYCNNRPSFFSDSSGFAAGSRVYTTVMSDAPPLKSPTIYRSPNDAALEFADNNYGYTLETGNECGAVMYRRKYGKKYYYCNGGFQEGTPKDISPDFDFDQDLINGGWEIVGYIHTHPNATLYSRDDYNVHEDKRLEYPNFRSYLVSSAGATDHVVYVLITSIWLVSPKPDPEKNWGPVTTANYIY